MPHYFTREEAEILLPQITVLLRSIQQHRNTLRTAEEELDTLRIKAMSNGHDLHTHMMAVQENVATSVDSLSKMIEDLQAFGCELKDPDMGLIDFLSLRNGQEIYLCWHLGEDRINYWHYLHTGIAGRQPLE